MSLNRRFTYYFNRVVRRHESFVVVVPEMVGTNCSVKLVCRVVNVMSVFKSVRIPFDTPVCVKREEESVPCPVLIFIAVLLFPPTLIVSLVHRLFLDAHFLPWYHCRVSLKVWSWVPSVIQSSVISCVLSNQEATNCYCCIEPSSEDFSWYDSWLNLVELVHILWKSHNWNSSMSSLHASSNIYSDWCKECSSNEKVDQIVGLILLIELSLVLPWPSLGTSHVLSETMSKPRVCQELIVQPNQMLI